MIIMCISLIKIITIFRHNLVYLCYVNIFIQAIWFKLWKHEVPPKNGLFNNPLVSNKYQSIKAV
jgi:hypothetical protein